jgi:hypothetical protein
MPVGLADILAGGGMMSGGMLVIFNRESRSGADRGHRFRCDLWQHRVFSIDVANSSQDVRFQCDTRPLLHGQQE